MDGWGWAGGQLVKDGWVVGDGCVGFMVLRLLTDRWTSGGQAGYTLTFTFLWTAPIIHVLSPARPLQCFNTNHPGLNLGLSMFPY